MSANGKYEQRIADLKDAVRAMLVEQGAAAQTSSTAGASDIWSEVVGVYGYLMNLSPADLRNVIFHSTLFTGTGWPYWHMYPEPVPEDEAEKIGYVRAVSGVPEKFWLGECPAPGIPRPLSVNWRDRLIDHNVVRYQACVSSLYHAGVLDRVLQAPERRAIIEVGPGHGCLSRALSDMLVEKATCILVDLPEMFLFQGAYLAVNRPDRTVYLYDAETFTDDFVRDELLKYDFALIPNYAVAKLHALSSLSAVVNIRSFQEMTQAQVEEYLDLANRPGCVVYSDNLDRHPYNEKLDSVGKALMARFRLLPEPGYYDELFVGRDIRRYGYFKQYVGVARAGDEMAPLPPYSTAHLAHQPKPRPSGIVPGMKKLLPKSLKRRLGRLLRGLLDEGR